MYSGKPKISSASQLPLDRKMEVLGAPGTGGVGRAEAGGGGGKVSAGAGLRLAVPVEVMAVTFGGWPWVP